MINKEYELNYRKAQLNCRYLDLIINIADVISDGHFTIMKFTTNWRGCFETPYDREDINNMLVANSKEELYNKMIQYGLERLKNEK